MSKQARRYQPAKSQRAETLAETLAELAELEQDGLVEHDLIEQLVQLLDQRLWEAERELVWARQVLEDLTQAECLREILEGLWAKHDLLLEVVRSVQARRACTESLWVLEGQKAEAASLMEASWEFYLEAEGLYRLQIYTDWVRAQELHQELMDLMELRDTPPEHWHICPRVPQVWVETTRLSAGEVLEALGACNDGILNAVNAAHVYGAQDLLALGPAYLANALDGRASLTQQQYINAASSAGYIELGWG